MKILGPFLRKTVPLIVGDQVPELRVAEDGQRDAAQRVVRSLAAELATAPRLDREQFRGVANEIKEQGGKASVVLGDLARKGEAQRVASNTIEALGGVDILINNAGGADEGLLPWLEQPADELLQHRYERFRYIDSLIHAEPHFGPKI